MGEEGFEPSTTRIRTEYHTKLDHPPVKKKDKSGLDH